MSWRAHAQALSAAVRPPSRAEECGNGTTGLRPRLPAGEQLWRVCYARAGGPAGGPAAARARQPARGGGTAARPGAAQDCRASLVFAGSAAALAADVQACARGAGHCCSGARRRTGLFWHASASTHIHAPCAGTAGVLLQGRAQQLAASRTSIGVQPPHDTSHCPGAQHGVGRRRRTPVLQHVCLRPAERPAMHPAAHASHV